MMRIEACDATLGAVVTDTQLAHLEPDTWAAVEDAFHTFGVLIFPGQHLSEEEQVEFAQRFGEIEHVITNSNVAAISNQKPSGELLPLTHPVMEILRGNEGWHTDSSYMPMAAKASMLSCLVAASHNGGTGWADMRAAYDALDLTTKNKIADLQAHHSLKYSQRQSGFRDDIDSYGYGVDNPPLRPLVKVHPVTGRPSLFIGRHAHAIPGLTPQASDELLAELLEFACRSPRIVEHQWQPGDLAVWDNRCVLHRARPYDYNEPRVLRHSRVAGDPATELV